MASRSIVRPVAVALVLVSLAAAAACGTDAASTSSKAHEDTGADHMTEADFAWGTPAEPGDADRVVEIEAKDDFTFVPEQVDVAVGETVTFRVTNTGKLPHDFTLGDADTQDEHDEEMRDMPAGSEHDEANAMTMAAGETKEMTWTFEEAGTVIMGCHIPGHYAAGMRGDVAVTTS